MRSSSNDMVINKWNDGFLFYAWLYSNGSNNVEDTEMSKADRLVYRLEMLKDMLDIDLDYPEDIIKYDLWAYLRHINSGITQMLNEYRGVGYDGTGRGSDKQCRVSRVA